MSIESAADWKGLCRVARVVRLTLDALERNAVPGITTRELDAIAAVVFRDHRARSAPALVYGFPGTVLISINDEVVHGIPGDRPLRGGDVVKLDVTLELDGYIADSAVTVLVPPAERTARALQRCARQAFTSALHSARAGTTLAELGGAVEREVQRHGFAVMRELSGHGVGRRIHESPSVPNFRDAATRGVLTPGLVIALEPMITPRPTRVVEDRDGWTLRTANGALSAHHEHTIVIRTGAPLVITM